MLYLYKDNTIILQKSKVNTKRYKLDKYLPDLEVVRVDMLEYFRSEYKKLIDICFEEISQKFSDISYKDCYRSYYVDQYELHSNISDNVINTLYIELKMPKYSIDKNQQNKILASKLSTIKNELFNLLITKSDKDTLLWETQYGIRMTYCQELSNDVEQQKTTKKTKKKGGFAAKILFGKDENNSPKTIGLFNCDLIIGVSFKNKNNKYGLKTFGTSSKDIIVNYPILTLENYVQKNYKTKDNFERYALLLKHIIGNSKLVNGDIIEMMLYNVPNEIYQQYSKTGLRNIINYLRNFAASDYITIDEQNNSFTSNLKQYSIIDAKEIIKTMEKYYINLN